MNFLLIFVGVAVIGIGLFWAKISPPSSSVETGEQTSPIAAKNKLFDHNNSLPPYSLVCTRDGRFNFVTKGGYVWPLHDFESLDKARELRDQMKAMDERDEREKRVWSSEERRIMDEVAAKRWDVCNEADPTK